MPHSKALPLLAAMIAGIFLLAGCHSQTKPYQSKLDPLALQAMQTQEFETSKATLFAATVSVFQDTGFIIEAGDLATGIITARSPTSTTPISFSTYGSSVTTRASAFVEATRPGYAKVRLNFVESQRNYISGYSEGPVEEIPNESPVFYEGVFNKIREGVFVRDSLGTPEGAPAGAPASK
jgi:hypothetical protein